MRKRYTVLREGQAASPPQCDEAANGDENKVGECNAMTYQLQAATAKFECEAYRHSFTCLTLKVLASNSPAPSLRT